ncbi:hypothetical protein [Sporosalibacterium faouarense]|uniref:hypothetical protein n=1 Tax=Sporosalibacterium faouarense TaxID=516123 RepID=UPI00192AFFE0|nr:hypothetical protein [Sporosalibacterium faouarense]
MQLLDSNDKYVLKIDKKRKIVYEKPIGYWKPEDIERLHKDYLNKVLPLLRGNKDTINWAKCVDLRGYKLSMILDKLQDHVKWAVSNGFKKGVIIVDLGNENCKVLELQMKTSTKDTSVIPKVFTMWKMD